VSSASTGPTLADVGEFSLIEAITADLDLADQVILGPGDDAAALRLPSPVLTSVDVLVEGVHFRRDWTDAVSVGRKSVAVNVADIEAMGGRAEALVVGFSAPAELAAQWALDFATGLRLEAARAGVSVVGGDVTRARDITIAVTVLGTSAGGSIVTRGGATPGDVLAVLGRSGWAAAGLTVLGRGFRSPRAVVEAYRVPEVPYGAGRAAAAAGATAMIDVSDGLLADLGHLAEASGVVIDVSRDAFEVPDPLQVVASATGSDPYTLILTGGEDHALAATFPAGAVLPPDWRVVGEVRSVDDDGPRVLVDGVGWDGPSGWDHFGSPSRGAR
jgi:thiamine-monophosphate kinase